MMETQELTRPNNGMEKGGSVVELEPMKDVGKSINLANLSDKREKYMQSLKDLRSDREAVVAREKELDTLIGRTEGAIISLNQLIVELDPSQAPQMGGQNGN